MLLGLSRETHMNTGRTYKLYPLSHRRRLNVRRINGHPEQLEHSARHNPKVERGGTSISFYKPAKLGSRISRSRNWDRVEPVTSREHALNYYEVIPPLKIIQSNLSTWKRLRFILTLFMSVVRDGEKDQGCIPNHTCQQKPAMHLITTQLGRHCVKVSIRTRPKKNDLWYNTERKQATIGGTHTHTSLLTHTHTLKQTHTES